MKNLNPHENGVSRHVPFEILVPPIAPGQETLKKTIMVEVVGDDEIITAHSMQTLDIIKMQMMIKRLNETVRQLTGMSVNDGGTLPSPFSSHPATACAPALRRDARSS